MIKQLIESDLKITIKKLGYQSTDPLLYIPEKANFGDYVSNIALQQPKQKQEKGYQSSVEIAKTILERFGHPHYLERIEIAGPGFINFYIKDSILIDLLSSEYKKGNRKTRSLVEYAQPNTHKAFHIGHLRGLTLGEAISRILEFQGDEVFRVTYGGDIGPHVAKCLWGIDKLRDKYESVRKSSLRDRAEFLGEAYSKGAIAYDEDPKSKAEIDEINKKLYAKDPSVVDLWNETKKWSVAYFETVYSRLGTEFDAMIWESEIESEGTHIVDENIGKVFVLDEGAIIFPGERFGLHNRVFVTSKGYPTYEAKELGLAYRESELFPYDQALHIIGNEQTEYFKVVTKALELLDKNFSKRKHLPLGMVGLSTGKMSSRTGKVVTADQLVDETLENVKKQSKDSLSPSVLDRAEKIAIAAIKFYMLKFSFKSDFAFDINQSLSLQGDTGVYALYSYVRTQSLLKNAVSKRDSASNVRLEEEEREVLKALEYFETIVAQAASEYAPSIICAYLINLSRAFNLFYEKHPILKSEKQAFRLKLTQKVGETLKLGLYLLGIETVDKM